MFGEILEEKEKYLKMIMLKDNEFVIIGGVIWVSQVVL